MAGWDCLDTDDHGFEATGRSASWYTVPTGGWAEDGCHGTFEAIPMSGDAEHDDTGQYAQWWSAGAATLARAAHPTQTVVQLIHRLTTTADRSTTATPDPVLGWGMVNPRAAAQAVLTEERPRPGGRRPPRPPQRDRPPVPHAASCSPRW